MEPENLIVAVGVGVGGCRSMLMAWDHTLQTPGPGLCGFYGVDTGQSSAIYYLA